MKVITRWPEIPHFESEEEEAAFWAEARLDSRLMNASILKADTRESTTITLRFDHGCWRASSASPAPAISTTRA
jgi:hypothetical protein